MYCRMNVYNGNTLLSNGFEAANACDCEANNAQNLFQITPVSVQTSIVNGNADFENQNCRRCCHCCRCCRRCRRFW
jgi:MinD superfamily P-loop ATPase